MSVFRELEAFFAWSLVGTLRLGFVLVGLAAAIILWPITIVVGSYYVLGRIGAFSGLSAAGYERFLSETTGQVRQFRSLFPGDASLYEDVWNRFEAISEVFFVYGAAACLPYYIWTFGGRFGDATVVVLAGLEGVVAVFLLRRLLSLREQSHDETEHSVR